MASYTTNYGLHQWVPEDNFLRMDFNEDFKKIDTAIKGVETSLQANLDSEVSRLDNAITTAQQTVQGNLNTQVTRLDNAITAAKQTAQNNLNALENELRGEFDGEVENLNTLLSRLDRDKAEIKTIAYVGDGAAERTINLGITPKALLVERADGYRGGGNAVVGGLALDGYPANHSSTPAITIVAGGFVVKGVDLNKNYTEYHCLALE